MSEQDVVAWKHAEIEGSDLGSERILVDFQQGRYYGMNATATFLFSLLREPIAIEALIDAVTERYQIPRSNASNDVFEFVETMRDHRLINVRKVADGG